MSNSREYPSSISAPPFHFDAQHGLHVVQSGARKVTRHSRMSPKDLWKHLGPIPVPAQTARGGDWSDDDSHSSYLRAREAKPGEWYKAQLALYGLKELKTPAAAKKALTKAVVDAGEKGLAVPVSIVELEQKLKEKWDAADVPFKKQHAENVKRQKDARKLQEERWAREEARRVEAAAKNAKIEAELKLEMQARNAGPKRGATKAAKAIALLLTDLAGTYHIVAPKLSDGWDDANQGDLTLTLSPSTGGSHLWGSISFGVFSGFLRSTSKIPSKTGVPVRFLWRGTENGEGQMTFDATNTGAFTFLPDGRLSGEMYWDCLGKFDFFGRKEASVSPRRASGSARTTRSTTRATRARVSRDGVGGVETTVPIAGRRTAIPRRTAASRRASARVRRTKGTDTSAGFDPFSAI